MSPFCSYAIQLQSIQILLVLHRGCRIWHCSKQQLIGWPGPALHGCCLVPLLFHGDILQFYLEYTLLKTLLAVAHYSGKEQKVKPFFANGFSAEMLIGVVPHTCIRPLPLLPFATAKNSRIMPQFSSSPLPTPHGRFYLRLRSYPRGEYFKITYIRKLLHLFNKLKIRQQFLYSLNCNFVTFVGKSG